MSQHWFAWRPVRISNRIVWLDWVCRVRDDSGAVRYFPLVVS